MQVEAAERHRIENGLRQDHAVSDHHGGISLEGAKLRLGLVGAQRLRRQHGNAKPLRLARHRRRLQLHTAPGGLRLARIHGHDLMAMGHQLEQRRHREIRRAHEDQTKRHVGIQRSKKYSVMAGLVPAIHAFALVKAWIPGMRRA